MKKNALAIVAILFITGCEKEEVWSFYETWKGPQDFGYVQAMRNDVLWEASAYFGTDPSKPNHFELGFIAFYPDSIVAESFSIGKIPKQVGEFLVLNYPPPKYDNLSSLYLLKHDDAPLAWYYSKKYGNQENKVWINEIDTVSGMISGGFDITFRKDTGDETTKFPNIVRFKNGVFKVSFRP